jgi:hypothetical protein
MPANDSPSAPPPLTSLAVLGHNIRQLSITTLRDAWRIAEIEATLALASWRIARRDSKRAAYAIYVAALDREAHAASQLAFRLMVASA